MNQKKASKPCACGRGRIYTGDNSQYNPKTRAGKQVCSDCKLEDIMDQIRNPNG